MIVNSALVKRIRTWVHDEALPLWIENGIKAGLGGPVEIFSINGDLIAVPVAVRTRVVARQLYTFSHAHLMGVSNGLDAAVKMFEFMTTRAWTGADRGWCKTLTHDGQPLDTSQDLYDFSFCLFGLAWYLEASGDERALTYIGQTVDIIDRDFPHPSGRGFHHCLPVSRPRQQNPHMHLMEAVLKLHSVAPSERLEKLASEIADLFGASFYNQMHDCLPEFFTDELEPIAEAGGAMRFEPGHQFEWAWILSQHERLSGTDHSGLIGQLVSSAERYGVCPNTSLTFNAVDSSGKVLDSGSRTWPNTERIKGWIGLYESSGHANWHAIESSCLALFKYHLGQAPRPGLWVDEFSKDGTRLAKTIPASTLYHVLLAFSEVLRIAPD